MDALFLCKLVRNHTHTHNFFFIFTEMEMQPPLPPRRKQLNLNVMPGLRRCSARVEQTFQPATNLIIVGCGGFRWGLALGCGPVRGLNPNGAGWPGGLHRSRSRADKSTTNERMNERMKERQDHGKNHKLTGTSPTCFSWWRRGGAAGSSSSQRPPR